MTGGSPGRCTDVLVPGDVVQLALGATVPADLRLLDGQPAGVRREHPDRRVGGRRGRPAVGRCGADCATDLAFMGTIVRAGGGIGVVVATGAVPSSATSPWRWVTGSPRPTSRRVCAALLSVAVGRARPDRPDLGHQPVLLRSVIDSVLFSLAIAVGIAPQLLPAVVSTSLATGSRRLARLKVLVEAAGVHRGPRRHRHPGDGMTGGTDRGSASVWSTRGPRWCSTRTRVPSRRACWPPMTTRVGGSANALDAALGESARCVAGLVGGRCCAGVAALPFDHAAGCLRRWSRARRGRGRWRRGPPSRCCWPGAPGVVRTGRTARSTRCTPPAGGVVAVARSPARRPAMTAVAAGGPSSPCGCSGSWCSPDRPKAPRADSPGPAVHAGDRGQGRHRRPPARGREECAPSWVCRRGARSPARRGHGSTMPWRSPSEAAGPHHLRPDLPAAESAAGRVLRDAPGDRSPSSATASTTPWPCMRPTSASRSTPRRCRQGRGRCRPAREGSDVLADGVAQGRPIFAATVRYVLMGTSSNFGNMFSAAGASAVLTFLPMLPSQILLNNLLYDRSPAGHPDRPGGCRADCARPAHWDVALHPAIHVHLRPDQLAVRLPDLRVAARGAARRAGPVPHRLVRGVACHPDA